MNGTRTLVVPKPDMTHIVVVGGGAGGLELATTLGNKLGRKGKAAITLVDRSRTHIWKPLLHEIAAGSMDVDQHELEYMAQGHWHGFKFRYGEMIGLNRANKQVILAATYDEEGREITPQRAFVYDMLVISARPASWSMPSCSTPRSKLKNSTGDC
jgi:NADH dehydrogenase